MNGKRVLVVDDDPDLRKLIELYLAKEGHRVSQVADGMSAIIRAVQEKPDLIVLDLGLPAGDGMSVLERVRSNTQLERIPVLVLSARDPETWARKAIELGAQSYLHKPVDRTSLVTEVNRLLGVASPTPSPLPAAPGDSRPVLTCPHCGSALASVQLILAPGPARSSGSPA